MRKFSSTFLLPFVFFISLRSNAQFSINPSFGKILNIHEEKPIIRYSLGFNNLLYNKIGIYYTYEQGGGFMPFTTAGVDNIYYQRDILGVNYTISNCLLIGGGIGFSMNGIINPRKTNQLRKEISLTYYFKNNFFLGVGYSKTVGLSTNFGLTVPLNFSDSEITENIFTN